MKLLSTNSTLSIGKVSEFELKHRQGCNSDIARPAGYSARVNGHMVRGIVGWGLFKDLRHHKKSDVMN